MKTERMKNEGSTEGVNGSRERRNAGKEQRGGKQLEREAEEQKRGEMWATATLESSRGAGDAADGCTEWIFHVCDEATSERVAGFRGGWGGGWMERVRVRRNHN